MGNLIIPLPYVMFIVFIFSFLLNTFILSKTPKRLWKNWYHEFTVLQPIGAMCISFGFLGYAIFYWTFKYNDILAFIAILIGFVSMLVGLFFSIRVIGLQREAKMRRKTL